MNLPGGGEPPPGGLLGEAEPAAYAGRRTSGGGVAVNTRGVAVMEAGQLIAGSTGKDGRGILPVVVEGEDAPGFLPGPDVHLIALRDPATAGAGQGAAPSAGPAGPAAMEGAR